MSGENDSDPDRTGPDSDPDEFYDAVEADVDDQDHTKGGDKEEKLEVEEEDEVSKMRSRQQKLAFARKLMTCESRDERREEEEEDGNDDAHRMEGISEIPLSVPDIILQSSPSSSSPPSSAADALLTTPPSASRDVSEAMFAASGVSLREVSLTEDSSIGSPPLATPPSATPIADASLSFWSTHADTPTTDFPDVSDDRIGSAGPSDTFRAAPENEDGDWSLISRANSHRPPPPDLVLSTQKHPPRPLHPPAQSSLSAPLGGGGSAIVSTPVAPPRKSRREKRQNVKSIQDREGINDESHQTNSIQPFVAHAVDEVGRRVTESDTSVNAKSIGTGLEYLSQQQPLRPSQPPPATAMSSAADDSAPNLVDGVEGPAAVAVRAAMKGIDATTGASLTDAEISVIPLIRDIDTGEMIPLSEYDKRLPGNGNPLNRLFRERADDLGDSDDSDCGSVSTVSSGGTTATGSRFSRTSRDHKKPPRPPPPPSTSTAASSKKHKGVKQFLGDLTEKIKKPRGTESSSGSTEISGENKSHGQNNNSVNLVGIPPTNVAATQHHPQQQLHPQQQQVRSQNILGMPRPNKGFEVRVEPKHKSSHLHFPNLFEIQTLGNVGNKDGGGGGGIGNGGPIWAMKFSHCGRLLATGGQDNVLRIWVLKESYPYFDEMKQKFSADNRQSPSPSHDSLASLTEEMKQLEMGLGVEASSLGGLDLVEDGEESVFMPKPFAEYSGHKADLLDISWSKNFFLLSASMDKTVRLWHVSRIECLCIFQHVDFVTAIAFHPKDDRYFLSGSLDGKLRLWNIPDKKVALWNEVEGQRKLITAANFCDSGKLCVVGTYDGRCVFYTDQLKYHTVIHVKSTRGKNKGKKITGITSMPGDDKKVLVTSNDSRVRLYDLNDASLACKFKGATNLSSQIKASFSPSGRFVICGSEDKGVYIWKTLHEYYKLASAARRDKNDNWEAIRTHGDVVTCTVFAPYPLLLIKAAVEASEEEEGADPLVCEDPSETEKKAQKTATSGSSDSKGSSLDRREEFGDAFVTADFKGNIKVFVHPRKPVTETIKRSSLMR